MIDLEIDISLLTELEQDLAVFGQELDLDEVMGEIAVDQLARIKVRTLGGVDFEGEPFGPYSESHAAFRKNPPRGQSPRPTDRVDLFFSGQMFGAMDWETIGDGVRLFFNDAQQAAKAHGLHHGYKPHELPARPFFEISDEDAVKIREQIEDAADKVRRAFFR
jgi:hypothetical protein